MGARLTDARWFRDGQQAEHRLWCHNATDGELRKRADELGLLYSLGVIYDHMVWEKLRVDAEIRERNAMAYIRERCDVCGGWRVRQPGRPNRSGYLYESFLLYCRDCGYPSEIMWGSNVVLPGPRTGFRLAKV
jgi:hypothetical protein